jgi:hypothetical protein
MRRRICLVVLVTALTAFGYLRSYEVTPTQASWSGWVPEEGYVGQTFTANFDSICYCDVFLGDTGHSHAAVKVEVRTYPDGDLIAQNNGVAQTRSHVWLNFPLTTEPGQKFIRGK